MQYIYEGTKMKLHFTSSLSCLDLSGYFCIPSLTKVKQNYSLIAAWIALPIKVNSFIPLVTMPSANIWFYKMLIISRYFCCFTSIVCFIAVHNFPHIFLFLLVTFMEFSTHLQREHLCGKTIGMSPDSVSSVTWSPLCLSRDDFLWPRSFLPPVYLSTFLCPSPLPWCSWLPWLPWLPERRAELEVKGLLHLSLVHFSGVFSLSCEILDLSL